MKHKSLRALEESVAAKIADDKPTGWENWVIPSFPPLSPPLPRSDSMTILNENQIACVDILKETLAQALEGQFDTIGIAVCMKNGFSSAMAGPRAGDLNLACDDLKSKILDAVRNSPKTQAVSRIVKARTM